MHLAKLSAWQGGCTLRVSRTNKVGNGGKKVNMIKTRGQSDARLLMSIMENIAHVVYRLSARPTNMTDGLWKSEEDGKYNVNLFHLVWNNKMH